MNWSAGEYLLYGGIALASVSAIGTIISLIVFRVKFSKLEDVFDMEYGEETRVNQKEKVEKNR